MSNSALKRDIFIEHKQRRFRNKKSRLQETLTLSMKSGEKPYLYLIFERCQYFLWEKILIVLMYEPRTNTDDLPWGTGSSERIQNIYFLLIYSRYSRWYYIHRKLPCYSGIVECTVYSEQHTLYSLQCTVNSVQWEFYSLQCFVYSN